MTVEELGKLIAGGETLTVEFKSDRKGLPDRDLIEAVVALANTEGGYEKYKAMVRAYIKTNGSAKRKNVAECCRINLRQAGYIVEKMLKEREIVQIGSRRWAIYKLA